MNFTKNLEQTEEEVPYPYESAPLNIESVGPHVDAEMLQLHGEIRKDAATDSPLYVSVKTRIDSFFVNNSINIHTVGADSYSIMGTMWEDAMSDDKISEFRNFIFGLNEEEKMYAEKYLAEKIHDEIEILRNEIQGGGPTPLSENDYMLTVKLRRGILLRYAVTSRLRREFSLECYLLYNRLKKSELLDPDDLVTLNFILQNVVGSAVFVSMLPDDLETELKSFTSHKDKKLPNGKLPSQSGENSMANFCILPPIYQFPERSPHKEKAAEILDKMQEDVLKLLSRISSFEVFIDLECEMRSTNLTQKDFPMLCSLYKGRYDYLRVRAQELGTHLEKTIDVHDEAQQDQLNKYMGSVYAHLDSAWERVALPALVFFAKAAFGKKDENYL